MSEYIVDLTNAVTKTMEELTVTEKFLALSGLPVLERITRCKDCKHSHMTTDGKCCKWCSIMATHQIDSNEYVDPPNGYDPEPYFDADFFCGSPRGGTHERL